MLPNFFFECDICLLFLIRIIEWKDTLLVETGKHICMETTNYFNFFGNYEDV